MSRLALILTFVVAGTAILLSCSDRSIPTSTSVDGVPVEVFGAFQVAAQNIRQVGRTSMDLPPTPRAYDLDSNALAPALRETDGRATIAFKEPGQANTISGSVGRATRGGVSPSAIRQGLTLLSDQRVEIRKYFSKLGSSA